MHCTSTWSRPELAQLETVMRCTPSLCTPRNCSSSSCCWTRARFGLAVSHLHMSEPRASLTRSYFAGSASLLPRLAFRRTPWLRPQYGYWFLHLAQQLSAATPPARAVARHVALQHRLLALMGPPCSGRPTLAPPPAFARHRVHARVTRLAPLRFAPAPPANRSSASWLACHSRVSVTPPAQAASTPTPARSYSRAPPAVRMLLLLRPSHSRARRQPRLQRPPRSRAVLPALARPAACAYSRPHASAFCILTLRSSHCLLTRLATHRSGPTPALAALAPARTSPARRSPHLGRAAWACCSPTCCRSGRGRSLAKRRLGAHAPASACPRAGQILGNECFIVLILYACVIAGR
jgi:hypothetical protein